MDTSKIGLFLAATIVLNVTPGPDTLYVLARSLGQGRGAGVVSVLGGSTGRLIHTCATAAGLSALLAESPNAFIAIRLAGALYLMVLGVRMLVETARLAALALPVQPYREVYRQGVLTNLLNPSVAIFFLSYLPQFTSPSAGALSLQIVVLGLVFTLSATIWSMTIALSAGWVGNWIGRHRGVLRAQRAFAGLVFVALGIHLALRR